VIIILLLIILNIKHNQYRYTRNVDLMYLMCYEKRQKSRQKRALQVYLPKSDVMNITKINLFSTGIKRIYYEFNNSAICEYMTNIICSNKTSAKNIFIHNNYF